MDAILPFLTNLVWAGVVITIAVVVSRLVSRHHATSELQARVNDLADSVRLCNASVRDFTNVLNKYDEALSHLNKRIQQVADSKPVVKKVNY